MTYEEIMRDTTPRLERKHLERYVAAYEGGTLVHGCGRCAVGHMNSEPGSEWGYSEYSRRIRGGWKRGHDMPALQVVEVVFEGLNGLWLAADSEAWPGVQSPEVRRRIIYEACVLELAKRDSILTERHPSKPVVREEVVA